MAEIHRPSEHQAARAIHQALEILARASADWRGNGAADTGPLHWPIAATLARQRLAHALEALEQRRIVQLRTPLTDWLCGHCGGTGFEADEPCEACGAAGNDTGIDTADARAGMAWWNSLTPTRRREWLEAAQSGRPADAWNAFKAQGT